MAQRYARALVELAIEQGTTAQIQKELESFAELFAESADLRNFLASPAVPRPQKQGVLETLVARLGAGKTLRNFLFVLVDNRRTGLLAEIRQEFAAQLHARLGVAEAEVTSAREMNAKEKADLGTVLERLTGMRVEARYALDAELIAGAVVRIGSTIYDGSVRTQLSRLRARLASE